MSQTRPPDSAIMRRDREVLIERMDHGDLRHRFGIDKRKVFADRLVHEMLQETHVVVGDHSPEPRH